MLLWLLQSAKFVQPSIIAIVCTAVTAANQPLDNQQLPVFLPYKRYNAVFSATSIFGELMRSLHATDAR
jgi:hypothetical protein